MFVADLLSLFAVRNGRELERRLEPAGFRFRDGDGKLPTGYRGTYEKIANGRLPADTRIALLTAANPKAARVLETLLWQVVDRDRVLTESKADEVLQQLSPEVRKAVFVNEANDSGSPPRRAINRHFLMRLGRISSLDAFAALLVLIRERHADVAGDSSDPGIRCLATWGLGRCAESVLMRLAVFPPFSSIWQELYRYIREAYFSDCTSKYPFSEDYLDKACSLVDTWRALLNMNIDLGLAGPSFREQMRIVNIGVKTLSQDAADALWEAHLGLPGRFRASPSDDLWRWLKGLRHASTRLNQPLTLPWQGRRPKTTRIANIYE